MSRGFLLTSLANAVYFETIIDDDFARTEQLQCLIHRTIGKRLRLFTIVAHQSMVMAQQATR